MSLTNHFCITCEDKSCATITLGQQELKLMDSNCCRVSYKSKENIIHSQTRSAQVAYIRKGMVKESLGLRSGNERITRIITEHHYLGLESVFADSYNHYDYTAVDDTEVCFIDRDVFHSLVRSNGNFAMEILRSVSKTNLYYVHHFIDFSQKQVSGKLSEVLLYLAEMIHHSKRFTLNLSRQELAAMAHVSRESLIRTLRKFDQEKIIHLKGKQIEILDKDKLEKIKNCG